MLRWRRDRLQLVGAEAPADAQPAVRQWGALARVVDREARLGVMSAWDTYIGQGRSVALPEAVCAVLEAYPNADVRSSFDCEACGFMAPARSMPSWGHYRREAHAAGRRVDPAERALLTTCPLCGGAVRWQGFNAKRWRTD